MREESLVSPNKLLSTLSNSSSFERLNPHFEEVSLVQGQILHKAGEIIKDIYFPYETSISLVLTLSDLSTTEIGVVGREGMIGLSAILSGKETTVNSVVQVPGLAMKIPSEILVKEFERGTELQKLLLLYAQARSSQIAHIAACQSHHLIEQRLARWLLLIRECSNKDTLPLTQKLISTMLGVRRASVTEAAISLQQAGIITYSRGQITIIDPTKLELASCECYRNIKDEYDRIFDGN